MGTKFRIAAVQMRSTYGDVEANLTKAEYLIREAVQDGAKLVVLPELFNIGYGYTTANYELTETSDGRTYRWLAELATQLNIHLAGSFLLLKGENVFNTLLLAAPDGQTWEYDKTHPWGWERAYFYPGKGTLIADTALGKIGMLICYDVAYANMFTDYAGKIQLLLISSCPPKMNYLTYHFPGDRMVISAETGNLARAIQDSVDPVFDEALRAQTAWLGVPMVNAMPHGAFESPIPRPKLSMGATLISVPHLWPLVGQAEQVIISANYNEDTLIAAANGRVQARPPQGDALAIAEVEIPNTPPKPRYPQPKMNLHPASRWASSLLSWMVVKEYRKNRKLRSRGKA